ncbi:unnamed protein product [Gongylonema pulchrum]|uniref:Uncharacterized protein n=1 Tax=Gongylonema pulchrum TaxID=637853 RepID=A0A183DGF0_9BILA|nr:unnamed protein product [Gongylonema pulchrum]
MVKEIEECRTEIRKNLNDSREKKANEKAMTEDLLLRLNQLQEEVKEMKNAIAQTRANTIAIEQKILSFISDI